MARSVVIGSTQPSELPQRRVRKSRGFARKNPDQLPVRFVAVLSIAYNPAIIFYPEKDMKTSAALACVLCSLALSGFASAAGLDDDELVFDLSARILVQADAAAETPSLLLQITNTGKTAKAFNVGYFPVEFHAVDAAGASLEQTRKVLQLPLQRRVPRVEIAAGRKQDAGLSRGRHLPRGRLRAIHHLLRRQSESQNGKV